MPWWRLSFLPENLTSLDRLNEQLDEVAFELIELGATSTAIETPPHIAAFFEGNSEAMRQYIELVPKSLARLVDVEEIDPDNWSAKCPEVWQPVQAGGLIVVPVSSIEDPRPSPPGAIRIIPGQGFGTGHHPTTRMILEELSVLSATLTPTGERKQITRAIDIGTGSGILAIAAVKLFRIPVDGTDIDPDALQNASDNIGLNDANDSISLSLSNLSEFNEPYDLVLGNLYGEVLVDLQSDVTRLSRTGTVAFLSGITEIVKPMVLSAFTSQHEWQLIKDRSEGGWVCLVLHRV